MIIPLNIFGENIYFRIFEVVNMVFDKLGHTGTKAKGRPKKYSDRQIVACLIYQVKNGIFSFRELEWRIKQDIVFQAIIGLKEVPDYSTFSIRANKIETRIFDAIYNILVDTIDPSFRICVIDSIGLRSSKYDKQASYGVSSRLGIFKGYKLHIIASADDIVLPIVYKLTTAEVYDNQPVELIYEIKTFNPFLLIGDAAYDDSTWFSKAKSLEINLLTDVNMRRAGDISDFKDNLRYQNALFFRSPIGKKLYRQRILIEHLFSILKGLYHLENPRLYGHKRYERHVMWVLFSYLVDEFIKKGQGITSRKYPWNL